MMLGAGALHQGAWVDVECIEDTGLFSVCERDKMSVEFDISTPVLCFIIIIIVIIIIIIIITMFISAVPGREEAAPRTTTAAEISPARPGLVRPLCQVRSRDVIFPLLCLMATSSVPMLEVLD